MLSDDELWSRVKQLEGETIYTIVQKKPNKVLRVTDSEVIIEGRTTRPSRRFVVRVYRYLCRNGEVTGRDWIKICGNEFCGKVGRITLAILVRAIPDQVESFTRDERGLSGIKLRK